MNKYALLMISILFVGIIFSSGCVSDVRAWWGEGEKKWYSFEDSVQSFFTFDWISGGKTVRVSCGSVSCFKEGIAGKLNLGGGEDVHCLLSSKIPSANVGQLYKVNKHISSSSDVVDYCVVSISSAEKKRFCCYSDKCMLDKSAGIDAEEVNWGSVDNAGLKNVCEEIGKSDCLDCTTLKSVEGVKF